MFQYNFISYLILCVIVVMYVCQKSNNSAIIIAYTIVCLFKNLREEKIKKYIYRIFYINPHIYYFLFSSFSSVDWGYNLVSFPCSNITLFSLLTLCYYVFVIHISFIYHMISYYYIVHLSFKSVKKEKNVFIISFTFTYKITFLGALYFFMWIQLTVKCHFLSLWMTLVFFVRQMC